MSKKPEKPSSVFRNSFSIRKLNDIRLKKLLKWDSNKFDAVFEMYTKLIKEITSSTKRIVNKAINLNNLIYPKTKKIEYYTPELANKNNHNILKLKQETNTCWVDVMIVIFVYCFPFDVWLVENKTQKKENTKKETFIDVIRSMRSSFVAMQPESYKLQKSCNLFTKQSGIEEFMTNFVNYSKEEYFFELINYTINKKTFEREKLNQLQFLIEKKLIILFTPFAFWIQISNTEEIKYYLNNIEFVTKNDLRLNEISFELCATVLRKKLSESIGHFFVYFKTEKEWNFFDGQEKIDRFLYNIDEDQMIKIIEQSTDITQYSLFFRRKNLDDYK